MSDIERFLAEVKVRFPKAPYILYGHSMGGNLALNFVLRKSPALAGVIASSPALRMAFDPPAWKLSLGKVLYSILPGFTMNNEIVREHLSRDPHIVEIYNQDTLVHDRVTARMALDVLLAGEWAIEHAAEFPLPLLLMHGGADKITSAAASQVFAQAVGERCVFELWDGLYHELHNEPEKELVFSFILDWLNALLLENAPDILTAG